MKFIVHIVAVCLLFPISALARTYTTAFPGTENPLSEGGNWVNGGVTGLDWTNVRKTPGMVFGTQPGTDPCSPGNGCTDSTAIVSGIWGPNQTVTTVANIPNPSTSTSVNEEIEIRVRSTMTAHSSAGYEALCSVMVNSTSGNYIQIVKWNGALGNFTQLNGTSGHCNNGDTLQVTITGTTSTIITFKINGATVLTATDSSSPWLSGNPGVGFFLQGATGLNANYGFSSFTATDGLPDQLWSNVISASRATDWSTAGSSVASSYPFTVDSWTQCGSTIPAGASLATVQNAINACTANHYVLLSAGTYNFSSGLVWNAKSGVALKGAGSNATFLIFSGGTNSTGAGLIALSFKSSDLNYMGGPSNVANWTAGYTAGTTSITLSSVTNLAIGDPLTLDQLDDASDNGAIFVSSAACCAQNGDGGGPRGGRGQQQIVTVTNIVGTTVTFSPPLRMPNWAASKTPQAWWPTTPISNSGFMDMSVDVSVPGANGLTFLAQFFNCDGCFALRNRLVGPAVINAPTGSIFRSLLNRFQTARSTVAFNYFYGTPDDPSVNYGTEAIPSADDLIMGNIFQHIQAPTPMDGTCSGCVVIYNFDTNDIFHNTVVNDWTFPNQGQFAHAVGDENILFEGNQGSGAYNDQFHGTHHFTTIFRANYTGWQRDNGFQTTGAGTVPVIMPAYNRFSNFIGNVTGNPNRHTIYKTTSSASVAGTPNITLGFGFNGNDNNTATTAMLWDIFPACTGGAGCNVIQASCSEVPSGLTGTQAPFANPCPSSTALPPSFFYASQPGWWPAGKPWPPVGPDVTGGNYGYCSSGTNAGNYVTTTVGCPGGTYQNIWAGHAYSLPAADCYLSNMNGATDGTGPVLAYNASACLASSGGGSPIAQLLPSPLTFSNQIVGTPSSVSTITVSNIGTAAMSISSIGISGDYGQTNNCPASLAISTSCTISVTFTPTTTGTRTGTVTVTDNASGSPHTVSLSGTGIQGNVGFSPTSLTFSSQNVGTTSSLQGVSLTNTGTAVLTITSITATGDFGQTNNCPISPSTLGVGLSCTINVTFSPTAIGVRSGSVSVVDNAASSPQSFNLTGTGAPGGAASFTPTSLTFPSQTLNTTSSPQGTVLRNVGTGPLTVLSVGASGNFGVSHNCPLSPSTMAVNATCTINVTFTPTIVGTNAGNVTVSSNSSGSPQTVPLSGTGQAVPGCGGIIAAGGITISGGVQFGCGP